jgi:hypothetical protein
MSTYFYKKLRPVNCVHYIKFSVNILLHTSGCCRNSVAAWITILSHHTLFLYNIPWNKAPRTGLHYILCTCNTVPFLWQRTEQTRRQTLLASACLWRWSNLTSLFCKDCCCVSLGAAVETEYQAILAPCMKTAKQI